MSEFPPKAAFVSNLWPTFSSRKKKNKAHVNAGNAGCQTLGTDLERAGPADDRTATRWDRREGALGGPTEAGAVRTHDAPAQSEQLRMGLV